MADLYSQLPMPLDRRIELLYVEDSAGDVLIMGHVLREFLHSVNLSVARDGERALAMLRDERFQPAMVILDLNLPVLSGFEVLETKPAEGYSDRDLQRVDAYF